jgi:pimeloyl-ACP methyl ester carboxylesterase
MRTHPFHPVGVTRRQSFRQVCWLQVLIVHGDRDALVPLSNSRALAAKLPNTQLQVVPQCGHVPQEEYPEGVAERISLFINSVLAASNSTSDAALG